MSSFSFTGHTPKKRHRNSEDGISKGEEGNKQVE
jgi:hypothetical protein